MNFHYFSFVITTSQSQDLQLTTRSTRNHCKYNSKNKGKTKGKKSKITVRNDCNQAKRRTHPQLAQQSNLYKIRNLHL